jgi:hypothetical protein
LLAAPAMAEPRFERVSLPDDHIYAGGWEHFVGGGVAVFDCNSDGLPEVLAAGGENPASFYLNSSDGDVALARADFPEITGMTGAYPLDIDGDGHIDLAILRVGPNMILKGDANCAFSDATAAFGFKFGDQWTTAFSATWEAGAAMPTLAFGNYVDRSDPDGPFEACDVNALYRPNATNTYDKTVLAPGHCALSMLFSDWDRSGTADLRVSNDRHYYVNDGSEQMWAMPELVLRDDAGWKPISIWGMGIASQDITGDGLPEVVLTSMGDQLMQFATSEGYEAAPFSIGTYAHRPYTGDDGRPSTGWHAQFGDVDNDGLSDLFIAKGNVDQMPGLAMKDPNNLLLQYLDGTFTEFGESAGIGTTDRSRGASLVDLNADGLLDLVVVNRRAPLEVYQNVTDGGSWLSIDIAGENGNLNGIGAWVDVETADGVQAQERTVGGGHVSGQLVPMHFGLGAHQNARVRIHWPNGDVSDWTEVPANSVVTLKP